MSTNASARPRRSVLYMPGSKPRALEKARSLPADCLILDLEDAVPPGEKETARETVARAVRDGGYGAREVIIRINGLDTEWGAADLAAASACGSDAILVPKVSSAQMVQEIAGQIGEGPALWAMMETPLGMLNAAEIAAASPRLACMVMGTNDLVKELGARHTPDRMPVMAGLGLCLLAARAHGLAILDGVYNAFKDEEGLRAECLQALNMGFDGKTLIHPSQLDAANRIFAPAEADVDQAKAVIDAFADPANAGKGVIKVNGKMTELLHLEEAERTVAVADAIAAMG